MEQQTEELIFRCNDNATASVLADVDPVFEFARLRGAQVSIVEETIRVSSGDTKRSLEAVLGWQQFGKLLTNPLFEDTDSMDIA